MSCVWNTLIGALTKIKLIKYVTPDQFVAVIKHLNRETRVLWNGQEITDKQQAENMERIRNIDIERINEGYDCSGCDPVLLLVSDLYKINILHKCLGNDIRYTPMDTCVADITIFSDSGHMWN